MLARRQGDFIAAVVDRLIALPRRRKVFLQIVYDFTACFCSGAIIAILLATGPRTLWSLALPAAFGAAVTVGFFAFMRLYVAVVRYITTRVSLTIAFGSLLGVMSWALLLSRDSVVISPAGLLNCGLTFSLLFGARYALRAAYRMSSLPRISAIPVAIYGAGVTGRQLISTLRTNGECEPMAFLDDDLSLRHREIDGLKVYGPEDLPMVVKKRGIQEVILALPSASKEQRRKILESLSELRIRVRTVPSMTELLAGKADVNDLRIIEPVEVLGRKPVVCDPDLMSGGVRAKNVLVTGAGGSIGSELCRQIALAWPKSLVMLDHSEQMLFEIDRELGPPADGRQFGVYAVLGSARDEKFLRAVLDKYRIDVVFHAAAYKHVPMLEENPIEGLANNVGCTRALLEAIKGSTVSSLTLVSSDKAVRPASIMGASKRVAELMVQAAADANPELRASIVRFGNVLGSSGSVLPIFQSQILAGGPVTLTHPDVTRYFMTIPEAVQLILQSTTIGQSGDLFHLDMGEPIRIFDLARRLIRLNGLTERIGDGGGDIEIKIVGLRPGEKLEEELLISNSVTRTPHPQIFRAREEFLAAPRLDPLIRNLMAGVSERDEAKVRAILARIVEGFEATSVRPERRLLAAVPQEGPATVRSIGSAASGQKARPAQKWLTDPDPDFRIQNGLN